MNIAAIIAVRDEVEFISANIDYHLSIGFKGIVVADILSSDGTGEKLDTYRENPKVKVVKAPSQDYEIFDWRQVLVDIAKETYQPDFISHVDPDEFLYSPRLENLDSVAFTQSNSPFAMREKHTMSHRRWWGAFRQPNQLTIRRFNCLSGMKEDFVAPARMRDIDHLDVVRHPASNMFHQSNSSNPVACLFAQVAPKVICRADKITRFEGGSHYAVDRFGRKLEGITSDSFVFIHFPFTTYERYLQKVKNIDSLIDMLTERTDESYAYHWKRWTRLYREGGDEAVLEEYQRQLAAITDSRYEGYADKARNCLESIDRGLDR